MADQTSITMVSKDQSNSKVSTSINYVNPQASNAKLLELAEKMNNLTVNTLESVSKTVKTAITAKPAPTFQLYDGPPATGQAMNSVTWSNISAGMANGIFSLSSSAIPYVKENTTFAGAVLYNMINPDDPDYNGWSTNLTPIGDDTTLDQLVGKVFCDNGQTPLGKAGTIVFAVDETDNYAAAEFTLTVTN